MLVVSDAIMDYYKFHFGYVDEDTLKLNIDCINNEDPSLANKKISAYIYIVDDND